MSDEQAALDAFRAGWASCRATVKVLVGKDVFPLTAHTWDDEAFEAWRDSVRQLKRPVGWTDADEDDLQAFTAAQRYGLRGRRKLLEMRRKSPPSPAVGDGKEEG